MSAMVQPTLLGLPTPTPKKATARRKRRPQRVVDVAAPVEYGTGVDAEGRATWTLRFPAPDRMLSVNGNPHWRVTSPVRKTWREAMFVHLKAARLPVGLAKVRIDIELRFPTAAKHDGGNYYANVAKPLVDACGPAINTVRGGKPIVAVGYGLIPDDTSEFLEGPFVVAGPKCADPKRTPFGEVVVVITNLGGAAA